MTLTLEEYQRIYQPAPRLHYHHKCYRGEIRSNDGDRSNPTVAALTSG
jgi:hypothetical protein